MYRKREEVENQQLRQINKAQTSPRGFSFKPASEAHRIKENIEARQRFEPDQFDANALIKPTFFRGQEFKDKWTTPRRFSVYNPQTFNNPDVSDLLNTISGSAKSTSTTKNRLVSVRNNIANNTIPNDSYSEKDAINHLSKMHEPHLKLNIFSARGSNKSTFLSPRESQMSPEEATRASNNTIRKDVRVKRGSHVVGAVDIFQPLSNRFMDTFAKIQNINKDLELNLQKPKKILIARQEKGSKGMQNTIRQSSQDDLLSPIEEFLYKKELEPEKKVFLQRYDMLDRREMNKEKFSDEQIANYRCKVTDEWQSYVNTLNKDFFDNNKLYIKSMQDYKVKNYKPKKLDEELDLPLATAKTVDQKGGNVSRFKNKSSSVSKKGVLPQLNLQKMGLTTHTQGFFNDKNQE